MDKFIISLIPPSIMPVNGVLRPDVQPCGLLLRYDCFEVLERVINSLELKRKDKVSLEDVEDIITDGSLRKDYKSYQISEEEALRLDNLVFYGRTFYPQAYVVELRREFHGRLRPERRAYLARNFL